jgi:hypothetical protein
MRENNITVFILFTIGGLFLSCNINQEKTNSFLENQTHKSAAKPGSGLTDTLKVSSCVAILYQPDSFQIQKIKATTDKWIYEGSMHEYYYQQRNAITYFKINRPKIKIINCRNARFLLFVKSDKSNELIDLDKLNDAYGLIVFDPERSPLLLDMTNLNSQVPDYFKKN